MYTLNLMTRASAVVAIALGLLLVLGACGSNPDKPPSTAYEQAASKPKQVKCPIGQVMICEAKRTGRIRFGKMGGHNLDKCSCEAEMRIPGSSPLPGVY